MRAAVWANQWSANTSRSYTVTHDLTGWSRFRFENRQSLSQSNDLLSVEDSLPYAQEPVTRHIPEPCKSSPYLKYHLLTIHFNSILSSMAVASKRSFHFKISNQTASQVIWNRRCCVGRQCTVSVKHCITFHNVSWRNLKRFSYSKRQEWHSLLH
jgi:hypothetical protein